MTALRAPWVSALHFRSFFKGSTHLAGVSFMGDGRLLLGTGLLVEVVGMAVREGGVNPFSSVTGSGCLARIFPRAPLAVPPTLPRIGYRRFWEAR